MDRSMYLYIDIFFIFFVITSAPSNLAVVSLSKIKPLPFSQKNFGLALDIPVLRRDRPHGAGCSTRTIFTTTERWLFQSPKYLPNNSIIHPPELIKTPRFSFVVVKIAYAYRSPV